MEQSNRLSFILKCESYVIDEGEMWHGHFTSFIREIRKNKEKDVEIAFRMQISTFSLPAKPRNTVMIGIGSGVAPFLGMIKHKQLSLLQKKDPLFNKIRLVFGFRNKKEDFVKNDFLLKSVKDNILDELNCVESRTDKGKFYVQDFLRANRNVIRDGLVKDDCVFFVCGFVYK